MNKNNKPFWLSGNFAPVAEEIFSDKLNIVGSIPKELNGTFVRNGANPHKDTTHWFVGDGMLHGVRIENGKVKWYRNRWVKTETDPEKLDASFAHKLFQRAHSRVWLFPSAEELVFIT